MSHSHHYGKSQSSSNSKYPKQNILMVAEKPLLAKSIAQYLSTDEISFRKGVSPCCPVHEFKCLFGNNSMNAKMTSVTGHIYTIDFNQKERSKNPQDLFRCGLTKNETNPSSKIPEHLKKEARDCDILVLWLDCDREGENICFEVIENTVKYMNKNCLVYRALFSSITKKDILKAFNSLGKPNELLSQAVECRREIDLRVGVAFSMLQTNCLKRKYPEMEQNMVSFGPCQTPTLGFCVERQKEIDNFVSKEFYTLKIGVIDNSGKEKMVKLDERFGTKDEAENVFQKLSKKEGTVVKMKIGQSKRSRPNGLNTVKMLKSASINLGIGPQEAMQIAEKLYTRGFISYPRTESTQYPTNFECADVLKNLKSSKQFKDKIELIEQSGINIPSGGNDKGDHPPIIPLRYPDKLYDQNEIKLFDLITNSFLASIFKDAVLQRVSVSIQFDSYIFSGSGKEIKEHGFMKILQLKEDEDDEDEEDQDCKDIKSTSFKDGQVVCVKSKCVMKGTTRTPCLLTESELISLMEKNGIGTDASIPTHIQNIITREYVLLDPSKRTLRPTKIGLALAKTLSVVDKNLITPNVRARIESMVNKIAKGEATIQEVLKEALDTFEQSYIVYKSNLNILEENFKDVFVLKEYTKVFSKCGKCGKFMVFVSSKKRSLLECESCKKRYDLPLSDSYAKQTKICPICGFATILVSSKKPKKKEMVCPCCFNEPNPFMKREKSGCLNCFNPNCKLSCDTTKTCSCRCGGIMCLMSIRKKHYCFCNRCGNNIEWKGVEKIIIRDELCSKCNDYHLLDILLSNDETIQGCMECNTFLKKYYDLTKVFNKRNEPATSKKTGQIQKRQSAEVIKKTTPKDPFPRRFTKREEFKPHFKKRRETK